MGKKKEKKLEQKWEFKLFMAGNLPNGLQLLISQYCCENSMTQLGHLLFFSTFHVKYMHSKDVQCTGADTAFTHAKSACEGRGHTRPDLHGMDRTAYRHAAGGLDRHSVLL
jgi:hypothetical protein